MTYPVPPQQQYGPPGPVQPQGQQPYAAPQPGYGQPVHAAPPPGYGQLRQCRCCGCVPAADVTFRGHRGMIILMTFLSMKGPFCRDCGLATFRQMTARTLIQGWYGYASFIITPITVLINLFRRSAVASLPPPQPSPYGESGRPMDPGPALLARPSAIIGLAVPFLLLMVLCVLIVTSQ